jgi:hypothetical protein
VPLIAVTEPTLPPFPSPAPPIQTPTVPTPSIPSVTTPGPAKLPSIGSGSPSDVPAGGATKGSSGPSMSPRGRARRSASTTHPFGERSEHLIRRRHQPCHPEWASRPRRMWDRLAASRKGRERRGLARRRFGRWLWFVLLQITLLILPVTVPSSDRACRCSRPPKKGSLSRVRTESGTLASRIVPVWLPASTPLLVVCAAAGAARAASAVVVRHPERAVRHGTQLGDRQIDRGRSPGRD